VLKCLSIKEAQTVVHDFQQIKDQARPKTIHMGTIPEFGYVVSCKKGNPNRLDL